MDRTVAQQLVQSVVEFLRSELALGETVLGVESAESVEVAVQCLETAYHLPASVNPNVNLYNVYREAAAGVQSSSTTRPQQQSSQSREPTDEEKAEAERLKNEGNTLMREEKFAESVESYTKAIDMDPKNAVYHCNRAAAYSKLNNHTAAIKDCQSALQLQPNYSKAYGRMGLAHSSLEQHRQARDCYKKALELEPDNDGYSRNLAIAEEKLTSAPAPPANPLAGLLSGGGGLANLAGAFNGSGAPDLSSLLSNPALMNVATQLMADPNMQNMMTNILGSSVAGAASTNGAAPPPPTASTPTTTAAASTASAPPPTSTSASGQPEGFPGIDALVNAGRQLAEQMQTQHPELMQQLRTQMDDRPPHQPPPQP